MDTENQVPDQQIDDALGRISDRIDETLKRMSDRFDRILAALDENSNSPLLKELKEMEKKENTKTK